MKKIKCLLSLFVAVFSFFVSSLTFGAILISPQNTPAAAPAYTHIPNEWQVASVYGPRDSGGAGSTLHKGIDYSQAAGNADKGVIIKAKLAGTIERIETGATARYISITSDAGKLTYIHIFDDRPLPVTISNANITARGYTRVVLDDVKRDKPTKNDTTCGAIFFYKKKPLNGKLVEKLDKLLTPAACSLAGKPHNIKAQTKVSAEEDIAPMGTSLPPNGIAAHLHLQLNAGADSLLTIMKHDFGLISGATKAFEISLQYKDFTADIINNMTAGLGFAVEVKENNLVPVLDAVNVSLEGTNLKKEFRFGGAVNTTPTNVDNILPTFILERGSEKPTIKPIEWKNKAKEDGSGAPRIMHFFVPYPQLKDLSPAPDKHTLKVQIKTVDGLISNYNLNFKVESTGCKIGNKGPAGGIIFYVKPGATATSCHGLEAAPADVTPERDDIGYVGFTWGCWGFSKNEVTYELVNNTSTAVGTGAANTAAIIAACGTTGGKGNGNPYGIGTVTNAAAAADAYTLNGYSDWFLPSIEELNLLYLQKGVVGGFASNYYWSSSEYDSYFAWYQYFDDGNQDNFYKYITLPVRAVRAF